MIDIGLFCGSLLIVRVCIKIVTDCKEEQQTERKRRVLYKKRPIKETYINQKRPTKETYINQKRCARDCAHSFALGLLMGVY